MQILLALLSLTQAHANPGARIACLAHTSTGAIYAEADLVSPTRLEHFGIKVFGGRGFMLTHLDGVRAPGLTRFYLPYGGDVLELPDSQLQPVRAILDASDRQLREGAREPMFSFGFHYVSASGDHYLTCSPKVAGDI